MYDKIKDDMVKAMKEKDKFSLSVIRMIKASIDKVRIDKKIEINDEEVINVLAKEVKMREESRSEFLKANRNDLATKAEEEIKIIKKYLPEPLTNTEVELIVNDALKEVGACSIKDMGNVMKIVTPKVKGRCDMSLVSKLIKEKLS